MTLSLKNTQTSYGTFSKTLHWITALLVISMLVGGFFMGDFDKALKPTVYMIHKSVGLLIFSLMVVRLIWNLTTGLPAYAKSLTRMQQKISTVGHYSLYLLLLIMPLTGILMSIASKRYPTFFNLFTIGALPGIPQTESFAEFMNESHEVLAWVFIVFVALHITAALQHRFIKKDGVFERMTVNRKK